MVQSITEITCGANKKFYKKNNSFFYLINFIYLNTNLLSYDLKGQGGKQSESIVDNFFGINGHNSSFHEH